MATTVKIRIGPGGRIVSPAEFRHQLGMSVGDTVVLTCDDREVRMSTIDERIRRAQDMVARYIQPGGPSMADELIAERRAEAARDD